MSRTSKSSLDDPSAQQGLSLFWTWWASPKIEISFILVSVLVAMFTLSVFDDYQMRSAQFASNHQQSEIQVHSRFGGVVRSVHVIGRQEVTSKQLLLILRTDDSNGADEEVLAPGSGRVKELTVYVGQRVQPGDVVVLLGR